MRKAFTLIELLVVIAVLGILAGLIIPKIGGLIDSARESTCRNNLRNLHTATMNHANDGGLTHASWWTWEEKDIPHKFYANAWIGALYERSDNVERRGKGESAHDPDSFTNLRQVERAIEFGDLFPYTGAATGDWEKNKKYAKDQNPPNRYNDEPYYVGGNKKIYFCPSARAALASTNKVSQRNIAVTYAMNGAFGCGGVRVNRLLQALGSFDGYVLDPSRVLLFAEIPHNNAPKFTTDSDVNEFGTMFVLYPEKNDEKSQSLGTYHSGRTKGIPEGLVIFLDGHIEKHPAYYGKVNTAWRLCRGLSADGQ